MNQDVLSLTCNLPMHITGFSHQSFYCGGLSAAALPLPHWLFPLAVQDPAISASLKLVVVMPVGLYEQHP